MKKEAKTKLLNLYFVQCSSKQEHMAKEVEKQKYTGCFYDVLY